MLEVRLIGTFDVKCDGEPVSISSRIAQSLFAYLILNAGTSHRREKLAGMFWPDTTEEKARAYLRHELWLIRKAFSTHSKSEYLLADDINISFNASTEHWLDAAVLKELSESAPIKQLMKGLSLFQGELLPGFYDDWLTQEREHLQAVYEQKMAWLLELLDSEKRWDDILEWAERWISQGQRSEAAYRYLMTAYDALGDRAKVASTYQRCVQALRELDLEPSEQTRALAFKRTHSLNIPIPLTSFIGREKELKELADLLSKSRLITLTGSGGVGKTRLSIQVVAEVLELFPDGVWFLDLAPLSDPALVPHTLVNLLGLRQSAEISLTQMLINYFHTRTAMLIFDNCEHLIESCAQLVNLLLISCADLSILATSREALRVSGEIHYRVPSLAVPKPDIEFAIDELSNMESVKLFVERTAVASPGFAIGPQNAPGIAQICQRLDGIPLAIELAAARTNVLSTQQILTGLDDRFHLLTRGLRSSLPRHQTLRAMIEWSYDLLTEKERLFFKRLAVFSGGWTLEAAEEVCSENGIETSEVLDLLSQLVNKSLVAVESSNGETRYRRLETIRQFAHELLVESGDEEITRTQHLKYFLDLSERAESALKGPTQMKWYACLNTERDNIRVALEWADKSDLEAGLYLSGRLYVFWESFDVLEGEHWLNKFNENPESKAYPLARAKALLVEGWLLLWLQQFDRARSAADKCLELYQMCGDKYGEVDALGLLAATSHIARARELLNQAFSLSQVLEDRWMQARVLGEITWVENDYQRRKSYNKEAIRLFREVGDLRWLVAHLGDLADLEMQNGDLESAQKCLDEALNVNEQLNNKALQGELFGFYGRLALISGDYEKARVNLQKAATVAEELGNRMFSIWWRVNMGHVALREGNINEARAIFSETAQNFREDKSQTGVGFISVVFALEGMACFYTLVGKPEHAAHLIGWADITREHISETRSLIEQADIDQIISSCAFTMREIAFSDAYDEGQKMTLDEILTDAFRNI